VPLRATVILPQDRTQMKALVGVEKKGKADADAVLYQGYLDAGVVGATLEKLESLIEPLSPTEKLPSLSKILDSEIIQRLRAVGSMQTKASN
jgi:hypothetical protein